MQISFKKVKPAAKGKGAKAPVKKKTVRRGVLDSRRWREVPVDAAPSTRRPARHATRSHLRRERERGRSAASPRRRRSPPQAAKSKKAPAKKAPTRKAPARKASAKKPAAKKGGIQVNVAKKRPQRKKN